MLSSLVSTDNNQRGNLPRLDLSRCLRTRNRNSNCTKCQILCQKKAISFEQKKLTLEEDVCNGCLLCTGGCKTGALTIPFDGLGDIFLSLCKSDLIVISCEKNLINESHIKLSCLGGLSEELLVSLLTATNAKIKIDLSNCPQCEKENVSSIIAEKIHKVMVIFPDKLSSRIDIVSKTKSYYTNFQERRAFFRALRDVAYKSTQAIWTNNKPTSKKSYSNKKIPENRQLLRHAIVNAHDSTGATIAENYFFSMTIDASCNFCGMCIGVCPTGALKISREDKTKSLIFQPHICTGCDACHEICKQRAIVLTKGIDLKKLTGYTAHIMGQ
ncbi:MAG: 4Fe-4S binding protein [Desulfobulbaceae bacterium]|nr:4Fe-4S binding protein [Desulfobulbaceae bacterium]HIJ78121.1 4Fe-4S binding protein [Deltaproteobacteria bacterium]